MPTVFSGPARAGLAFLVAVGLATLAAAFANRVGEAALLATMATPAIAVLLVMVVTGEARSRAAWRSLGLGHAGFKGWLPAILVPVLVLSAGYAAAWALGFGTFAPPAMTGSLAAFVVEAAVGLVISIVLATTEEVGWRGYMLPRVLGIGPVRAMLLVGLLHGVWHLPLILMTPYYQHAGNPLVVVPLFLVALTLAGVFYGWLRLTTASVWPVAIAHAVVNNVLDALNGATATEAPEAFEYVAGESGVLIIAGLAAIALYLVPRVHRGMRLSAGTAPA